MLRSGLFNFSKGEIAEELIARVDVPTYNAGLKRAENVVIHKYGGVMKRPGTRFVAEAYDSTHPVRLFPFQFSLTQAYALEMGQLYLRVAANGGLVLETPYTITAITQAASAQVTAAYHGYSVGEQVFFDGVAGMTEINGRTGTVTAVIDADNFVVDIDTRGFSAFTGDSGGTVNTGPPAPPPTTPPPPTPPSPPPDPPVTGGGEGSGDGFDRCVTIDTLVLMADGTEKAAGTLSVGDKVRTQHEHTLKWGDFMVLRAENAWADECYDVDGLVASKGHRTWRDGKWVRHEEIGKPVGGRMVSHISVEDAHTYVSAGVLSHNLKML